MRAGDRSEQAVAVRPSASSTIRFRAWWQTFAPGLVVAVVTGSREYLVAYVQPGDGATWEYVSSDGGRRWRYSTALDG